MSLSHAQARSILASAFRSVMGRDPSTSEVSYSQAVAWLENQYGRAGQFAAMAADGNFNWGSLHARGTPPDCPAGSRAGSDQGSVCFQVFPTDEQAAAAFLRVLVKNRPSVLAAMSGTPEDVAHAMRATGYYTAPEATYAAAIRSALKTTGGQLGTATVAGSSGFLLVALAIGGYWAYTNGYFRRFLS